MTETFRLKLTPRELNYFDQLIDACNKGDLLILVRNLELVALNTGNDTFSTAPSKTALVDIITHNPNVNCRALIPDLVNLSKEIAAAMPNEVQFH